MCLCAIGMCAKLYSQSAFLVLFQCAFCFISQEFRRDEYGWHYKNAHSEIHGGLNGWLIERCPLAQYGCKFARLRFSPAPENSSIVYNDVLESFGVACKVPSCKILKSDMNRYVYSYNFTRLFKNCLQNAVII